MKENQFEVIVPAYDALESELEDILGGSGCGKRNCQFCKPNYGDSGDSGNCTEVNNTPTSKKPCCPGLVAVMIGSKAFCLPLA